MAVSCCSIPHFNQRKASNKTCTMLKRILSLLLVVITALVRLTGAVGAAVMPADNAKPAVQYIDWAADSIDHRASRRMLAGRGRGDEGRGRGDGRGRGRGRGGP
jgi:hypothetical protein